jgi:transposase InsO family protein
MKALVDCGCQANVLSLEAAARLSVKMDADIGSKRYVAMNGQDMGVIGKTEALHTVLDSHGNAQHGKDKFVIGPVHGYDVVLGMPWLAAWNPVPDFASKTIAWGSRRHRYRQIRTQSPQEFAKHLQGNYTRLFAVHVEPADTHSDNQDTDGVPNAYREYSEVFDSNLAAALPQLNDTSMAIELQEGKQPPHGPLYNLSQAEMDVLKAYLHDMMAKGWIRHSKSPAGAPILFVKKKDGGMRLCVDYRGLNAVTIKNRCPLPLIQESLDRLGRAKVFSKMDLRDAYHRIRIQKGDEWKTAFRTRYGHFEYLVVPFGLTNAPAIFQSHINRVLSDLLDICCIVYLDDILIFSENEEDHIKHVKMVLGRLREHKLYAKPSKCSFHKTEVNFLGYVVTQDGVKMEADRVATVQDWPTPTTVREVRVFLGFANYYRRFIKGYSRIANALNQVTVRRPGSATGGQAQRKEESVPIELSKEAQDSFVALKAAFSEGPVLRHFDPKKPTRLETDASGYAISGIISQQHPDPSQRLQWHPVAFYSRKMAAAEQNYDTHDQELLAIIASLQHWRHYLQGARHQVEILTDHHNLQGFLTTKTLIGRQVRWAEWLASFDVCITHRPGKLNPADGPSRRPDYEEGTPQDTVEVQNRHEAVLKGLQQQLGLTQEASLMGAMTRGHSTPSSGSGTGQIARVRIPNSGIEKLIGLIKRLAPYDPQVQLVEGHVRKGTLGEHEWVLRWTQEGRIWRMDRKIYVPNNARLAVLQNAHDDVLAGHFGTTRTLERVTRDFWWPKVRTYCKEYVQTCQACGRSKASRLARSGHLFSLPIPSRPWKSITMDFITDLPESKARNKAYNSILVVVDRYTKMAHYFPCKKTITAASLADLIWERIIRYYGGIEDMVSDRGSVFTSEYWATFCYLLGVRRKLSTAFHPQTDGQTERQNQTLEQYLRIFCNYEQDDWASLLVSAELAYNDTVQESTKTTPFKAAFGDDMKPRPYEDTQNMRSYNAAARSRAQEILGVRSRLEAAMKAAQDSQAKYYNAKRSIGPQFQPGDAAWLDIKNVKTKRPSKKLDYKLIKVTILEKLGPITYRVRLPDTLHIHDVFHVSLLRPLQESSDGRPQQQGWEVYSHDHPDSYDIDDITERTKISGKWHYKVHYTGYGTEDDEWLPQESISPEGIRKFLRKTVKANIEARQGHQAYKKRR